MTPIGIWTNEKICGVGLRATDSHLPSIELFE
jgi:hypothetical protein